MDPNLKSSVKMVSEENFILIKKQSAVCYIYLREPDQTLHLLWTISVGSTSSKVSNIGMRWSKRYQWLEIVLQENKWNVRFTYIFRRWLGIRRRQKTFMYRLHHQVLWCSSKLETWVRHRCFVSNWSRVHRLIFDRKRYIIDSAVHTWSKTRFRIEHQNIRWQLEFYKNGWGWNFSQKSKACPTSSHSPAKSPRNFLVWIMCQHTTI